MFINNFDPVAFEIFSLEIRWYSLSYIFGLVFGWYFAKNKLIKDSTQKEIFDDYITYLIISIILGGRLGYVIIYDPIYFISNPVEIIKIWQGGMSFHGALIGIIIGTYFFCKNKNQICFIHLHQNIIYFFIALLHNLQYLFQKQLSKRYFQIIITLTSIPFK